MISFRYHLVSIIGIFLAIALGVVVGTTALNGAVVGDLRRQVSDLQKTAADTAARNKALTAAAADADTVAKAFAAKIAGSSLANRTVIIVSAPGASSDVRDAVATQIAAAGGKVTGRVQLSKDLTDPSRAADVRSLATSGVQPVGLQLPTTDDAGTLAGALLGYVLLGHGQGTDLTQVLTGFSTLNMAKADAGKASPAKVAVLLATGTAAKSDAGARTLLSFASEFGKVGGPTVVVGDAASATGGGLIALVRADAAAHRTLASVDDADRPLGQLTTVLATADALAGHKGHYGTGAGADALVPDAAG